MTVLNNIKPDARALRRAIADSAALLHLPSVGFDFSTLTAAYEDIDPNVFEAMALLAALEARLSKTPIDKGEKIEGMTPTQKELLEACNSKKLSKAIDELSKNYGQDSGGCLELFGNLLHGGLIHFTCEKGARETVVELTTAGKEQLFNERTRFTGRAARSILDELDAE